MEKINMCVTSEDDDHEIEIACKKDVTKDWYMDSGATKHMSRQKTCLKI